MWQFLACFLIFPHVLALELDDLTQCEHPYLLKRSIVPVHYDLYFRLNVGPCFRNLPCTFDGTVMIKIHVLEQNVCDIQLHSGPDILIKRTSLHKMATRRVKAPDEIPTHLGLYNNETFIQQITTNSELEENSFYILSIDYESPVSNKTSGFYRSQHFAHGYMGLVFSTQMEPDMARAVFPCFDEPRYKATFRVAVEVEKAIDDMGYHPLSNAKIEKKICSENTCVTTFEKTRTPFSTYLFALVLSDFKPSEPLYLCESAHQAEKVEIRHWAPPYFWPESGDRAMNFTLPVVPAIMNHFTTLFGMGYKWTKLDQIAIPKFFMGAMENPGLITYRDDALFPPKKSTLSKMLSSIYTVVHELSHQWLGNTVTIEWWRDTWLTEGFATWAETMVYDLELPGIKPEVTEYMIELVYNSIQQQAYIPDQLSTSPALSVDAWTSKELFAKFEAINYGKGAKILTMFMHGVGEEAFIKAVRAYLKEYALKNVQPKDFLKHLQNEAGDETNFPTSVCELFSDWFNKPGYPVVTTVRNRSTIYLSQERFVSNSCNETLRNSKWFVPITYSTNLELNFCDTKPIFYMEKSKSLIEMKCAKGEPNWYIINNQAAGMYRVNYDPWNWSELHETLAIKENIEKIHKYNRAQLVDDIINLAVVQYAPYLTVRFALKFLTYLENERNILPWLAFMQNYKPMLCIAAHDGELLQRMKKFITTLVTTVVEDTKKPSSAGNTLLRDQLSDVLDTVKKPARVLRNLRVDFSGERFGQRVVRKGKRITEHYKISNFLKQKQEIIEWIREWCRTRPPSSRCPKE